MSRLTKLACAALMALTLAGGAAYAPVQQLAGDPSQWGVEGVYKQGSFDITETEQSIAGSAGGNAKISRESALADPIGQQLIAGSKGDMANLGRESA
jgi:hypothetical protein